MPGKTVLAAGKWTGRVEKHQMDPRLARDIARDQKRHPATKAATK